jgi:hypothetical protein
VPSKGRAGDRVAGYFFGGDHPLKTGIKNRGQSTLFRKVHSDAWFSRFSWREVSRKAVRLLGSGQRAVRKTQRERVGNVGKMKNGGKTVTGSLTLI